MPTKEEKKYALLDWDSNLFGFKVAKIIIDKLDSKELGNILADFKQRGGRLVYWPSDPLDEGSQRAAAEFKGFLADQKTAYEINLGEYKNDNFDGKDLVEEYLQETANNNLIKLSIESGCYCRFKVDPNFPDGLFEKLYKSWIENSANKTIARAILVIKEEDEIVGMITLGEKNNIGDIGLIAVDQSARRKGYGKILVNAAIQWFIVNNFRKMQVITQGKNIAACKLYEKSGFLVKKVENFYHFWISS